MPRKTFSKKITSDELTSQINKENIDIMNRFLKEKSTRTSDKTIVVYKSNLLIFFTYNLLHNDNKPFRKIKKLEFADFFSYAADTLKLGSARLNNLRSVLSSLSLFIEKFYDEDEDYKGFRNVILKTVESAPKEVRRTKTILTDEQIESLLQYLSEKDSQKACWLALAICSGARFSELLRFDMGVIDEKRLAFGELFLETTHQLKTKGRGRGGKLLYKYILRDKFLPYYKAWLPKRELIMKEKGQEHISLFVKEDGTPVTEAAVRHWIIGFENYLGVPFYAHACRHYLTTLLSKKNVPPRLIQEIFGWSTSSMVELYDDSTAHDKTYAELEGLKL